jgi:hypothetical protein
MILLTILLIIIDLLLSSSIRNKKEDNVSISMSKRWRELNKKMLKWVEEIEDRTIKMSLLYDINQYVVIPISDNNMDNMYNLIVNKYINHIPSLRQEIRNRKLNELIKY